MIYDLVVRCQTEPLLHAKVLRIQGKDLEWVQTLAELLEGTSRFYIMKPGDLCPIAKCAICRGSLKCEIKELASDRTKYWQQFAVES